MTRIGIYGGTFDPVHFGHIQLALSLFEQCGLDEIFWVPAKINPLKPLSSTAGHHRLEMLRLALEGLPYFKVLDLELNREGPSYTIDTLKILQKEYPEASLRLILGDDTWKHFNKWKDPEEILKIAPPLVGSRSAETTSSPHILRTPLFEISATAIRNRLSHSLYCGHLVPTKVLDYIAQNGLYFSL